MFNSKTSKDNKFERAVLLDQISGGLAAIGFLFGKLKFLPIAVVGQIFDIISLGFYILCYLFWLGASYYYPNLKAKKNKWYNKIEFKTQYIIASALGILGTVLCLAYPPLLVVGLWLYTLSNFVWAVGEYHKAKSQPDYDHNFVRERQYDYFRYTVLLTLVAVVPALAATAVIFFPAAALLSLYLTIGISTVLGSMAVYFWCKSHFGYRKESFPLVETPKLDPLSDEPQPKPDLDSSKNVSSSRRFFAKLSDKPESAEQQIEEKQSQLSP